RRTRARSGRRWPPRAAGPVRSGRAWRSSGPRSPTGTRRRTTRRRAPTASRSPFPARRWRARAPTGRPTPRRRSRGAWTTSRAPTARRAARGPTRRRSTGTDGRTGPTRLRTGPRPPGRGPVVVPGSSAGSARRRHRGERLARYRPGVGRRGRRASDRRVRAVLVPATALLLLVVSMAAIGGVLLGRALDRSVPAVEDGWRAWRGVDEDDERY